MSNESPAASVPPVKSDAAKPPVESAARPKPRVWLKDPKTGERKEAKLK